MKKAKVSPKSDEKKRPSVKDEVLVGDHTHRTKRRPTRFIKRNKIFASITLFIVLFLIVTYVIGRNSAPNQSEVTNISSANQILRLDDSDNSKSQAVEKFSTEYDAATKEIQNANPTTWDKTMLDKAYMSLLYADKVGAFTQVYTVLSSIEAAEKSGLDIDDNSVGIKQNTRDAIRQRADTRSQATLSNQGGSTSE